MLAALAGSWALLACCAVVFRDRRFTGYAALDDRTYVAPSNIPGAGMGLFAARDLEAGDVIAELGGRLVFESRVQAPDRGYLARLPDCARLDAWPFDTLDASDHGGHGSRINFAPRTINGRPTHLQNAAGRTTCRRPYIRFEATRAIPKGTEILASYGPEYDYGFMAVPAIRDHFCGRSGG